MKIVVERGDRGCVVQVQLFASSQQTVCLPVGGALHKALARVLRCSSAVALGLVSPPLRGDPCDRRRRVGFHPNTAFLAPGALPVDPDPGPPQTHLRVPLP